MTELLRDIVARNRAGQPVALPSVCTAHSGVIAACLARAAVLDHPLVVEATSNQINPDGGYTGQSATDFVAEVKRAAERAGLAADKLALGGDHLGPQAWRNRRAREAMDKARIMVADYVRAGFTKIHLDCSEPCADDGGDPLSDTVVAARSAELARACLEAAPDPDVLDFVIGTEVPPPGGARIDEAGDIPATTAAAAEATLCAHREAFDAAGLGAAFAQVAGLVVQPGVEFSPMAVHAYPMDRELPFRTVLADWPGLCLEAHSTDYQDPDVFRQLAREGFAFQKVGPALTFAWREAVYRLDIIAGMLGRGTSLRVAMEQLMCAEPGHWQGHYRGGDDDLRIARHFGLADRIRYYWPHAQAQAALAELFDWLEGRSLPDPLLAQVFPADHLERVDAGSGKLTGRLLDAAVQAALDPYMIAKGAG